MKWSVNAAANEWRTDRRTLTQRLKRIGLDPDKRKSFTTRQITKALTGDLEAEKIRETSARADLLEWERAEKRGDLMPTAQVAEIVAAASMPMRNRLLALPSEAAARCNPTDPQFAREALEAWRDDALALLRSTITNALQALKVVEGSRASKNKTARSVQTSEQSGRGPEASPSQC